MFLPLPLKTRFQEKSHCENCLSVQPLSSYFLTSGARNVPSFVEFAECASSVVVSIARKEIVIDELRMNESNEQEFLESHSCVNHEGSQIRMHER